MLKVLRITAGLALLLSATGFLIEGGFSRYAKYGIPPHANWMLITIGLAMAVAGGLLIRPGILKRGGR